MNLTHPVLVCALFCGAFASGCGPAVEAGEALDETAVAEAPAALNTNDPWIGVVPAGSPITTPCAQGWVSIYMDDEDSNNNDSFTLYSQAAGQQSFGGRNFSAGGLVHTASPRRAGGNTRIQYCPTRVTSLPTLRFDYALISASNQCPAGTFRFSRRFDNEDDSNHNSYQGDISPNVSVSSASLINFCFVPRGSGGRGTWDSGLDGQIIFSAGNEGALNGIVTNSGTFGTDDEDDSNHNAFSSTAADLTTRMRAIIAGGGNTVFNYATQSPLTTVDLGTRSTCDVAYLQQQAERQIECSYGRNPGAQCNIPGWKYAVAGYDKAQNLFCMY